MKRFYAIFVVAMLLLSCTKGHDEVVVTMQPKRSTTISAEQALKNLYGELKLIDGQTRADGSQRTVKSIKSLTGAITRSGNALDNDLLYIVEFDEGEGSAVLAADTRLDPVIAVLDNSVLTAEDFASDNTDDIDVYVASLISSYAEVASTRDGHIPAPGHSVVDTVIHAQKFPLLKTKWHQGSPFNNKCVTYTQDTIVAGCVAIAMGQFIYYHGSPDVINGYTVNWSILSRKEYSSEPITLPGGNIIGGGTIGGDNNGGLIINPGVNRVDFSDIEAANFIYNIGVVCNINYLGEDTSANASEMLSAFDTLGYSVSHVNYNSTTAKNLVLNDKPVVMTGAAYVEEQSKYVGHAWLLDGWLERTITTTTSEEIEGDIGSGEGGAEITVTEDYCNVVHCNFGWEGKCDGYYNCNVFDVSSGAESVEPSIGDLLMMPYPDLNFDNTLKIFVY